MLAFVVDCWIFERFSALDYEINQIVGQWIDFLVHYINWPARIAPEHIIEIKPDENTVSQSGELLTTPSSNAAVIYFK